MEKDARQGRLHEIPTFWIEFFLSLYFLLFFSTFPFLQETAPLTRLKNSTGGQQWPRGKGGGERGDETQREREREREREWEFLWSAERGKREGED